MHSFPHIEAALQERHLCATERLLPHQYLAYKASLLREAEREGSSFTRSHAKYMFRLRSPLAVKIYDFLVACGWIATPQPAQPGGVSMAKEVSCMHLALFADCMLFSLPILQGVEQTMRVCRIWA